MAVFALTLLLGGHLAAAQSPSNAIAEAHNQLGKKHYDEGHFDVAIEEFARAYSTSPDIRYLYNLGNASAARWKPVEALEVFERYLAEGGDQIPVERRNEVAAIIAEQQTRIAWLELRVAPDGATVRVDGKDVGKSPFAEPIPLARGEHLVFVSLEGHQSIEQKHQFKGQERNQLVLTLTPMPPPSPRKGQLAIHCLLPEVQVFVDGRQAATTPVDKPLLLEEGTRTLRLERPGYRPQKTETRVSESALTEVKCDIPMLLPPDPKATGFLELKLADADMDVLVDGHPAHAQASLPTGLHHVEVRRFGFEPWRLDIRVGPGEVHAPSVILLPTPAYQREMDNRAKQRRNWAYVLGATGIASLGTALGVGIWNFKRHEQWEGERDYIDNAGNANQPDWKDRRTAANDLDQSVRSFDLLTVGLAVAGGVMLAGAAFLYPWRENTRRSSELKNKQSAGSRSTGPQLAPGGPWHPTTMSLKW